MTATEQPARQAAIIDRLTTAFDWHDPDYTPGIAEIVNRAIRERTPVAYSSAHGGMWVLSRYEDVKRALRDHETFSSASGVHFPRAAGIPMFAPIDFDLPDQAAIRNLMVPPLKKQAVHDLEASVRALAASLVEPIAERGHGDLVTELVEPYAIGALGLAIGLSDGTQRQIRELTSTIYRSLGEESDATTFWQRYRPVLAEEIRHARENPGDYHLSWLVNATLDGKPVSEDLLYSIIVSYCVAGHANTMNAVNRIFWWLANDVDLQRRLRRAPELIATVGDEVLRRWCPTDRFTRVTTREVTVDGVTIPTGARVVLLFDAANRDPGKFPNPEEFSLDRANSHHHLSYGHGIHRCLGEHFARMEFGAMLSEIVRHPTFHLTEDVSIRFDSGRHIIFDSLKVQFDDSSRYQRTGCVV